MEEGMDDDSLNDGDVHRNDNEQITSVVANDAGAGDEQGFEVEPSPELQAVIDREDDGEEVNAQNVFDEEDSGDDDFTAALKLDISVFGEDPERTIPAETLDDINEDDLSYDEFDSTLKSDIPMLDHDMQTSAEAETEADATDSAENEEPIGETHSQSVQVGSIGHHPSPGEVSISTGRHQRFYFQGLVHADVGGRDENDADNTSQDQKSDSDEMDEMIINDVGGTSNSQVSNDTQNEQEGVSSGTPVQDGKAYLCSNCGSRRITHRCAGVAKAGGKETPVDSSLSPDGTSHSSEVLQKGEKSERLQGVFHARDKVIAVKSERLEIHDDMNSRDKVIIDREVKVEVRETKALASRSLRQSNSGVTRLKVKMSSELSVKDEVGPMSAALLAIKEAPTTAKGLLATGILSGFRVRYMDRHGKVCVLQY